MWLGGYVHKSYKSVVKHRTRLAFALGIMLIIANKKSIVHQLYTSKIRDEHKMIVVGKVY